MEKYMKKILKLLDDNFNEEQINDNIVDSSNDEYISDKEKEAIVKYSIIGFSFGVLGFFIGKILNN